MARLGASVTGLDASSEGIDAAYHRKESLQDVRLDKYVNYKILAK